MATKNKAETEEIIEGQAVEVEPAPENGLVKIEPLPQADHHIVTGMAMLARMDDKDYEQAIAVMQRGMERVQDFQTRAMTKGEDYGTVKGIDRPFLHLPGAEKLCLLYGLAARQEADRIIGEQVLNANGDPIGWKSPPIAYHVRTYIHVGSFDGPVVAMGYGEASSWETKYRYTWERPICPQCGHEMMKGKNEGTGKMVGKWFCPGFKGGCWYNVPIADMPAPQRVENPDPWSLAETLIQMAAKRSFVAATRRATGTSGLFTQDEDSPSVERQSDEADDGWSDEDTKPKVETVDSTIEIGRGAKTTAPTQSQIERLSVLSKEKDLGPTGLARVMKRVLSIDIDFGDTEDRPGQSVIVLNAIRTRTADDIGRVIYAIETGAVPPDEEQSAAPDPEPAKADDDEWADEPKRPADDLPF